MLKRAALLTVLSLFFATSALAHTSLKTSEPEAGAMLMSSPEKLTLNWGSAVNPISVKVKDASGQPVDFSFSPSSEASESFSWSLPSLKPGQYTVSWVAMGKDAHKIQGDFGFMVH